MRFSMHTIVQFHVAVAKMYLQKYICHFFFSWPILHILGIILIFIVQYLQSE